MTKSIFIYLALWTIKIAVLVQFKSTSASYSFYSQSKSNCQACCGLILHDNVRSNLLPDCIIVRSIFNVTWLQLLEHTWCPVPEIFPGHYFPEVESCHDRQVLQTHQYATIFSAIRLKSKVSINKLQATMQRRKRSCTTLYSANSATKPARRIIRVEDI